MPIRLLHLALLLPALAAAPQTQNPPAPYTLTTGVDEVSLTFHASDPYGVPLTTLTLADLRILDNNKPPRAIVSFDAYTNLPIRAGILLDISPSMDYSLARNFFIATAFADRLLHTPDDRAFLLRFDSGFKVIEDWTPDANLLTAAIPHLTDNAMSHLGGTALYDALYRTCRDQFGTLREGPTANVILLFTDGIDNASHALIEDDTRICQRAHTSIYVFSDEPKSGFSPGQKILTQLTEQTGGRIFFDSARPDIAADIRLIESNLRAQYRLVYKPQALKPNGAFHRIKLETPGRAAILTTPTGYNAPLPNSPR
jgi:VWFA-related protein